MTKVSEQELWKKIQKSRYTYTAAKAKNSSNPGSVPEEYLYVDCGCFLHNGKVHEVKLPSRCVIIGKQAFEGCQFQKEVKFPEGLKFIGERAFAGNHRLRRVHFPRSLLKIGKGGVRSM